MFTAANIITGLNLLCGVISILFTFSGRLEWAVLAIILGAIFDFLDGMTARVLKQQSSLGKELDSLADMVTFGVAPGMIVFVLLIISSSWETILMQGGGLNDLWIEGETMGHGVQVWINTFLSDFVQNNPSQITFHYEGWNKYAPFFALLIPFFSMFRLAKFNLDTRQATGFIGLPTPANSIFFAAFALMLWDGFGAGDWKTALSMTLISAKVLIPIVILFSLLLIAEIPLFSLKFSDFKWKGNEIRIVFLLTSLIILPILWVWGLPVIILLYIAISLIRNKFK